MAPDNDNITDLPQTSNLPATPVNSKSNKKDTKSETLNDKLKTKSKKEFEQIFAEIEELKKKEAEWAKNPPIGDLEKEIAEEEKAEAEYASSAQPSPAASSASANAPAGASSPLQFPPQVQNPPASDQPNASTQTPTKPGVNSFFIDSLRKELTEQYLTPQFVQAQQDLTQSTSSSADQEKAQKRVNQIQEIRQKFGAGFGSNQNTPVNMDILKDFIKSEIESKKGQIQGDPHFIAGGRLKGDALVRANEDVSILNKWQERLEEI